MVSNISKRAENDVTPMNSKFSSRILATLPGTMLYKPWLGQGDDRLLQLLKKVHSYCEMIFLFPNRLILGLPIPSGWASLGDSQRHLGTYSFI